MFKLRLGKVTRDKHHIPLPNDDFMWLDERLDWTSGNVDYRAVTESHKAEVGGDVWWIWKYTWDSTPSCTRVEGPLLGSWTGRAALAWA